MTGPTIPVAKSDCILWDGPVNEHGYGRYTLGGVRRYAHRDSYCDYHGLKLSDIDGVVIRHTCDNPPCINPEHLVAGTQADNIRDMDNRGRRKTSVKYGEEHPNTNITDEMADKISMEYDGLFGSQKKLSVKYGLSTTTINRIVNNKDRFKYGT